MALLICSATPTAFLPTWRGYLTDNLVPSVKWMMALALRDMLRLHPVYLGRGEHCGGVTWLQVRNRWCGTQVLRLEEVAGWRMSMSLIRLELHPVFRDHVEADFGAGIGDRAEDAQRLFLALGALLEGDLSPLPPGVFDLGVVVPAVVSAVVVVV